MSVTEALEALPTNLLDGVPADKRVVIIDVTWDDYERLVEQIGEARNCRVAFDGKDIEMLTLGPLHERQKSVLDRFVMIVSSELKVEHQPMGSTTWKRKKVKRAIESDLCYYFDPAKLAAAAAAAQSDDVDLYPNPDVAAEVDISAPKIDRPGIYAALQVPEFCAYAIRSCPSNGSVSMGRIPRRCAAVSCPSGPRMSPGGSSARIRAAWWRGKNAYAGGYGPKSPQRQTGREAGGGEITPRQKLKGKRQKMEVRQAGSGHCNWNEKSKRDSLDNNVDEFDATEKPSSIVNEESQPWSSNLKRR